MQTITFPDGSQMTSTALTNSGIETVFQYITAQALGLWNDPNPWSRVRIAWQSEGQPGPSFDVDTVFLRCSPEDTEYARMHDVTNSMAPDGITLVQTDIYTRSWKTHWTFYGPNSDDLARAMRSILVTIQFVADYLASFNLYVNPDIPLSTRNPELFQARWWEREDLDVVFNEQVTETFTIGTVKSVEVITYTKDGQQDDFTVTTS